MKSVNKCVGDEIEDKWDNEILTVEPKTIFIYDIHVIHWIYVDRGWLVNARDMCE